MNNAYQDEITSMSKFRYSLIKRINETKEENENEIGTTAASKKVDELGEEILKYINTYFDSLPFDFIMDELANLGQCPNLLNDDNGHWAVTGDGYQNVVAEDEPEDVETHFFVEANEWKNTPKEALLHYLNQE